MPRLSKHGHMSIPVLMEEIMGLFSSLLGPSIFDENNKNRDDGKKKSVFDRYTSAEDYAEDHREDHDGWEDAMDAWYMNKKKKK